MNDMRAGTEGAGLQRWCAEIVDGQHDDHLDVIAAAITRRMMDGAAGESWAVSIPDLCEFDEDTILLLEAERVERETGVSWVHHDPTQSASVLLAYVRARLEISEGLDPGAAAEAVAGLKVTDMAEWVRKTIRAPDPKERADAGSPPTT